MLAACATRQPELVPPATIVAPYDTSLGQVLWAVVPPRNESGTTLVDPLVMGDKLVAAAAQIRGVIALPLNRTIDAMRALELAAVNSPDDARRLADELGVDGLIVGSITAYDPYEPVIGLSVALYARPGRLGPPAHWEVDPRRLSTQPTEPPGLARGFAQQPLGVVAEHLDAKNHQVQMDVRRYATGRHEAFSALGWRRYLASADLFAEFAAWHVMERLVELEWLRTGQWQAMGPG